MSTKSFYSLLALGLALLILTSTSHAQGKSGKCKGGCSGDILGTPNADNFCVARPTQDEGEVIQGYGGMDSLCGFGGNDSIHGGEDGDSLDGGPGDDVLSPGPPPGMDVVNGGPGDDRILPAIDGDTINGGDGFDWISVNTDRQQIVVNFTTATHEGASPGTILDVVTGLADSVASVERVTGTANDDIFYGSDNLGSEDSVADIDESFGGGRGDDVFYGGGGNDFIGADRGNDTIFGGPNNDWLRGAENNDRFEFLASDFTTSPGAEDIIEDFNLSADCIELHSPLVVLAIDTTQNLGGKGKPDSIISVDADGFAGEDGTIVAFDVSLSESDLGCPAP